MGAGNSSSSGNNSADPAYISEVFEYRYGPGQHAGSIGTAEEQMRKFLGTNSDYVMLGGWGGYIVAGFDHNVQNLSGYDFAVFTQPGVGSEQGVVYVMPDDNGNGRPDPEETLYELSGSETDADYSDETGNANDKYIRNYEVTYYKPGGSDENITWSDNQDPQGSGELVPGYPDGADSSDWWWDGYGSVTEVTFSGVKLPHAKYEEDGSWKDHQDRFASGYAENYGADDIASLSFGGRQRSANRFDIDDAVDSSGNSVSLDSIRFIKVQTGVFQIAGQLNEISTEVSGAVDLHMLGE